MDHLRVLMEGSGLRGVGLFQGEGHPMGRVLFTCEQPDDAFKGVGGEGLFESDLMVDENDDYDRCVIERKGKVLVASRARVMGRETTYVEGSLVECEQGSKEESAFIANALEDFSERAVGPLASLIEGAKRGGLKMGRERVDELVVMVRSVSSGPTGGVDLPGRATQAMLQGTDTSRSARSDWERLGNKMRWSDTERLCMLENFLAERDMLNEFVQYASAEAAVESEETLAIRSALQDGETAILTYDLEGELLEASDQATGREVPLDVISLEVLECAEALSLTVEFPRSSRYGVPSEATQAGGEEWAKSMGMVLAEDFDVQGEDTGDDSCMRFRVTARVQASWKAEN